MHLKIFLSVPAITQKRVKMMFENDRCNDKENGKTFNTEYLVNIKLYILKYSLNALMYLLAVCLE